MFLEKWKVINIFLNLITSACLAHVDMQSAVSTSPIIDLVLIQKYDERIELNSCEKAGVWKLRLLFLRRLHLIVAALVVLSLYDFVIDLFSNCS